MTARAEVVARIPGGALMSGTPLRCEIEETYRLQDGQVRTKPRYEAFVKIAEGGGS